jgi:hypothetical protein
VPCHAPHGMQFTPLLAIMQDATWRPLGLTTRFMASETSKQQPDKQQNKPQQQPGEQVSSTTGQATCTRGSAQAHEVGCAATRANTCPRPSVLAAPQAFDSLELTEEKMHAITDKIPQRPVGVVEGTSYGIIMLGAFGVRRAPETYTRH